MNRWKLILMPALLLAVMAGQVPAQDDDDQGERRHRRGRGSREGMRERMSRNDGAPKVGEWAPVFKAKSLDGKRETDLASFRGQRPVVLFFGSYT